MIYTEYNAGSEYARNCILSLIIGMQNNIGNTEATKYQAYQDIYDAIVMYHGDMFENFKG